MSNNSTVGMTWEQAIRVTETLHKHYSCFGYLYEIPEGRYGVQVEYAYGPDEYITSLGECEVKYGNRFMRQYREIGS